MEKEHSSESAREKMNKVYSLFGVNDTHALWEAYFSEDQRRDPSDTPAEEKLKRLYDNSDYILNKAKTLLEQIDEDSLTKDEKRVREEILWLWYHHGVSQAIWKKDKQSAQAFAKKARSYECKNQITDLLHFLVNDKLEEAKNWAKQINNKSEQETAEFLIREYEKGKFFK